MLPYIRSMEAFSNLSLPTGWRFILCRSQMFLLLISP